MSKLILFGEGSLRRVVTEYLEHYHRERNHQGKGNLLLFPASSRAKLLSGLPYTVESASVDCSGTTAVPHEYFDQTQIRVGVRAVVAHQDSSLRFARKAREICAIVYLTNFLA